MKAFGFIALSMDTGFLIKILAEDGHLLDALEVRKPDQGKKFAKERAEKQGYQFLWLDKPEENADLYSAKLNYASLYGIKLNGKEDGGPFSV